MRCVSVGWHEALMHELPRVVLSFRPDVLGLYRNLFNADPDVRWARRSAAEVMGLQIVMQKLIIDHGGGLIYARDLVSTLLASINGRLIGTDFNKLLLEQLQVHDADTVPRETVRCFPQAFVIRQRLEVNARHFEVNMRTIFKVLKFGTRFSKYYMPRLTKITGCTIDAQFIISIQSLERKRRIFEDSVLELLQSSGDADTSPASLSDSWWLMRRKFAEMEVDETEVDEMEN